MELYNALGFSAAFLALAFTVVMPAPGRSAMSWAWMGVAGALVLGAIALPIGLFLVP